MRWWCTDDALMMRWWCAYDALMMRWWCSNDAQMHWCADEESIPYHNLQFQTSMRALSMGQRAQEEWRYGTRIATDAGAGMGDPSAQRRFAPWNQVDHLFNQIAKMSPLCPTHLFQNSCENLFTAKKNSGPISKPGLISKPGGATGENLFLLFPFPSFSSWQLTLG